MHGYYPVDLDESAHRCDASKYALRHQSLASLIEVSVIVHETSLRCACDFESFLECPVNNINMVY